jgi:PIN domain nuclease of toxin-antitoxin system
LKNTGECGTAAFHRDPFDRVLIPQAAVEEMTLVTADAHIRGYGIRTRDAIS